MAVTIQDELQGLFPHWLLGRRETIWLWIYLQSRKARFDPHSFSTRHTRAEIADYIKRNGLTATVDNERSRTLLSEHVFGWIEREGRQPAWLLPKADHTYTGSSETATTIRFERD